MTQLNSQVGRPATKNNNEEVQNNSRTGIVWHYSKRFNNFSHLAIR